MFNHKIIPAILVILAAGACTKYLDEKSDKRLVVPSTFTDLQAILDYTTNMNADPASEEISSDNYYLTTADWLAMVQDGQRRIYTWAPDNIFDTYSNDWSSTYRKVYYANTVLDVLDKMEQTAANKNEWGHLKAQALFARGRSFFQVAGIWSLSYDAATASTDLGIPLRMNTDFTQSSERPSLELTYQQLLNDLKSAVPFLPVTPLHPVRASKPAAYAMLSRVYLSMRDYANAGLYADSCLQLNANLLDYNTLSPTANAPIPPFCNEMLYYGVTSSRHLTQSRCRIDSVLYQSYASNDLRKSIFFRNNGDGSFAFKGTYDGSFGGIFSGLATDEVYLTRAECYARSGDIFNAMAYLNKLLIKRYKTGTFIPLASSSTADALTKILVERRKELVMRCVRWMDIKRLNKEGANISLKRLVNNQSFDLSPNDLRFALPIPEDIILLSGMQQNPR